LSPVLDVAADDRIEVYWLGSRAHRRNFTMGIRITRTAICYNLVSWIQPCTSRGLWPVSLSPIAG
jgi:hypothetical protein